MLISVNLLLVLQRQHLREGLRDHGWLQQQRPPLQHRHRLRLQVRTLQPAACRLVCDNCDILSTFRCENFLCRFEKKYECVSTAECIKKGKIKYWILGTLKHLALMLGAWQQFGAAWRAKQSISKTSWSVPSACNLTRPLLPHCSVRVWSGHLQQALVVPGRRGQLQERQGKYCRVLKII